SSLLEAQNQPGLDGATALEIEIHILDNRINLADFVGVRDLGGRLEAPAEAAGRPDLAMLTRRMVSLAELMLGVRVRSSATWSRMFADAPNTPVGYEHPHMLLGWEALLRDDLDHAKRLIGGLADRARAAGDLGLHAAILPHVAQIDLRHGRPHAARA